MGKQAENKSVTRENLMTAFWSLYQKKSIEKITIREITQAAGYNRGTFYDYFIDIYDALDQLQDSLLDYTQVAIDEYRNNGFNQEIVEYITKVFYVRGDYFSVFLGENRDPNFPGKMKKVVKPIFYEVWKLSESSEEASLIFEFAISAIIGMLSYWYKSEKRISYEEFLTMMKSMLMNGMFGELQKVSGHVDTDLLLKEVFKA